MLQRLAWRQLVTEKRRLLAALAGIVFAVLLQLMQLGFRDALFTSATLIYSQIHADLVLASSQYTYVLSTGTIPRRRLYQAGGLPEVASVVPLYVAVAPFKNVETHRDQDICVIGFRPDDVVLNLPSVIENSKHVKIPDVAIFDTLSRPYFGPVVEGVREKREVTTEVRGRRTKIVGVFDLGVTFAVNGHLITSDVTFRRMFGRNESVVEFGLIRLKPGANIASVQAALARLLPHDVQVVTRQQLVEMEQAYWDRNTPIGFIFLLGLLVSLLVGSVIVYQILYTDVGDHLDEYATLKAMGFSNRHFYLVVIEEAVMLSVLGFPIGLGLSQLLYRFSRDATHLPIVMTSSRAALVLTLTIGMSTLAGLIAMRRLRAADPAEVF
jgi:putative ABC transport system permease protein